MLLQNMRALFRASSETLKCEEKYLSTSKSCPFTGVYSIHPQQSLSLAITTVADSLSGDIPEA